jgi:hypothetical protein
MPQGSLILINIDLCQHINNENHGASYPCTHFVSVVLAIKSTHIMAGEKATVAGSAACGLSHYSYDLACLVYQNLVLAVLSLPLQLAPYRSQQSRECHYMSQHVT